jgi:hypothetical protein
MLKNTLKLIAIGLIAAFAVGSVGVVHAQEAKTESSTSAGSKKKGVVPFRGKINEIDKAAKTINIGKEKKRTIQITDQTKITKDGKPATLDDANAGDEVGGAYRDADGKLEASSLRIGPKPEGAVKASAKKKKKE